MNQFFRDDPSRPGTPVTISDVARLAGVSPTTVSRALTSSYPVAKATKERIQRAVDRLGYRPNALAQRLVKSRSEALCFVLSNREFLNPFHSGILCGAEQCCSQAGKDLIFTGLSYPIGKTAEPIPVPRILRRQGGVDGVILAGTNSSRLLERLDALRLPYVVFGNNLVDSNKFRPDDTVYFEVQQVTRSIIDYLVSLGHRHMVFVGDASLPWFRGTCRGYRKWMRQRELEPRELTPASLPGETYVEYGKRCVPELLRLRPRSTAVFAANDQIAFGIWQAFQSEGINVPADCSLVGFDDVESARMITPALTTVHVPTPEIGRACAQLLLEKLDQGGVRLPSVTVPTRLVVRNSCGPASSKRS